MHSIIVLNSKGGSGKTTVATNLASYYAAQNFKTALMDYDPQGSSLHWLSLRPAYANTIHGADAAKSKGGVMRSWRMNIPTDTQKLIIDVPAGVEGFLLQDTVRKADCIVVPVGSSKIDVHATADFIKDLLLIGKVRASKTKVAVVANRVRKTMPVYEPLERFLTSLKLPFVTKLTDSDNYIKAFEQGLGVFEMNRDNPHKERDELRPLLTWLENPRNRLTQSNTANNTANNVIPIRNPNNGQLRFA